MAKLTNKESKIIAIVLTAWGIIFIGSGYTIKTMDKPVKETKTELQILQKRVSQKKTNELKLKDIELEINTPLSLNIKDYLENIEEIDNETINSLKLDTSMVNITEAGTYKYTIIFNKKKYNGNCTIKEKPLPNLELKLNNLKVPTGTTLSTNLEVYISETLEEEVKKNIILDLSKISTTETGIYQYTITYNNKLYTGTIEVYEPQSKDIIADNQTEDENNKTTNEGTNENETEEENKTNQTEE